MASDATTTPTTSLVGNSLDEGLETETQSNEVLRKTIHSFIQKGMKILDDEFDNEHPGNIATLSWGEPHDIKFFLTGVPKNERSGIRYPKLTIEVGEEQYNWTAKCGIATENGKIVFKIKDLNNNGTSWSFCEINTEERELSAIADLKLPKPNNINSDFVEFWFSNEERPGLSITRNRLVLDQSYTPFSDSGEVTLPELPNVNDGIDQDETLQKKWAQFFIGIMCWRFILICGSGNTDKKIFNTDQLTKKIFSDCLPESDQYVPKRPVDIDPHELLSKLDDEGLKIPWHLVTAASAALNAGKNLIFTGPPGCGKTHLASIIGEYVNKNPLTVTASQSWTTDEIIGRYMPNIDGTGLEFKDGFFLKALQEERWLIIDEVNRCDIDNCFGELFTVLSGKNVTLPFEKPDRDNNDELALIQLVVDKEKKDDSAISIQCRKNFRLLATMNDADVAGLNQLSYALRRRFAILRVDAPNNSDREAIFSDKIERIETNLELMHVDNTRRKIYRLKVEGGTYSYPAVFNDDTFKEMLKSLFANQSSDDLITLRIVGIAPVLDIIGFVGEGLRSSSRKIVLYPTGLDLPAAKNGLLQSFLAMGLVLNVFPQLDAVTGEPKRFKDALRCIYLAFGKDDRFWYIERAESAENDESDNLNLKEKSTIGEYLASELKRQYATDDLTLSIIDKVFTPSND